MYKKVVYATNFKLNINNAYLKIAFASLQNDIFIGSQFTF